MDARIVGPESGFGGAGEGDTPHLELAGFSGPLDLLLSLARTRQIDLAGLPLKELVDQLATALQQTGPSLGERGAWLVMACWLLLLRSRLLLPADATAQQQAAEDAAAELRGRLLDLQSAQALAYWLDRRPQLGQDVFARGQPEPLGTFLGAQHQVDVIEFLWAAMGLFDDGDEEPGARSVYRPRWADLYKLGDARDRILRLLALAPDGAPLGRFLPDVPGEGAIAIPARLRWRAAWTSTFLASLQLTKEGEVVIAQEGAFAPLHVCKAPDAAPGCFAWAFGLEGMVSD
jgi:segregation and condensation protein A